MSKTLVLDVHLSSKTLLWGLRGRGHEVSTLEGLGLAGDTLDAEMAKCAGDKLGAGNCVLVTIDMTIVEDSPGFDWSRYAIAWIKPNPSLRGSDVEAAKHDVFHRYLDRIAEQEPGDHYTYTRGRFYKHPPSLISRPY
jgi:hypothetical protein